MTKLEAVALAVRLHRIWVPDRELQNQIKWRESLEYAEWDIVGPQFQFFTYIQKGVFFLYLVEANGNSGDQRVIRLNRSVGEKTTGELLYHSSPKRLIQIGDYDDADSNALHVEFAAKWMPFFRLGLWLSGEDMEATSHEKAQWIEWFTREEIEAWNLNF